MDWSAHYPDYFDAADPSNNKGKKVEFADVGCGFGGLLIALAPLFPDTLMLGKRSCLSIHIKVIADATLCA